MNSDIVNTCILDKKQNVHKIHNGASFEKRVEHKHCFTNFKLNDFATFRLMMKSVQCFASELFYARAIHL